MILLDANLLVYAYNPDAREHDVAYRWLEGVLRGRRRVGLPWESSLAFVRLVTNRRLFPSAASVGEAWGQVRRWLAAPPVWVPGPMADHGVLLEELLATPGLDSHDVPDAHLAAIALAHGLELASHDAGFARFDNLRWFDPLRSREEVPQA